SRDMRPFTTNPPRVSNDSGQNPGKICLIRRREEEDEETLVKAQSAPRKTRIFSVAERRLAARIRPAGHHLAAQSDVSTKETLAATRCQFRSEKIFCLSSLAHFAPLREFLGRSKTAAAGSGYASPSLLRRYQSMRRVASMTAARAANRTIAPSSSA